MRKRFVPVLAALMLCSLFTGCAGQTGDSINVISREDGSGTRGAFIELFGVEQKDEAGNKIDHTLESAEITNSTSVMLTTVAGDENAIGYVSMGALGDTVKAVAIDGVTPGTAAVKDGSYSAARPFNIALKADASALAQDFIAFILSDEGQSVVEESGYISQGATGPYAGTKSAGKLVVGGSSSVTPVMEKLKEAYVSVNPDAAIEVQQSDSTTGMNAVLDGVCDIGMASRTLKESELAGGLLPTVIAMDGIAVIVNPANPVNALTSEQVRAIFTGESANWSEVA